MTLLEAIQTGRPFKREGHDLWQNARCDHLFTVEEILATDWEVETPKKELSAEEIKSAYYMVARKYGASIMHSEFINLLTQELGLT